VICLLLMDPEPSSPIPLCPPTAAAPGERRCLVRRPARAGQLGGRHQPGHHAAQGSQGAAGAVGAEACQRQRRWPGGCGGAMRGLLCRPCCGSKHCMHLCMRNHMFGLPCQQISPLWHCLNGTWLPCTFVCEMQSLLILKCLPTNRPTSPAANRSNWVRVCDTRGTACRFGVGWDWDWGAHVALGEYGNDFMMVSRACAFRT
jgi:hypothetical protein